jgi:ankyrin repeat protein
LIFAVYRGHKEIVKLFLEDAKIDINLKDKRNATALTWASANGHTEIVQMLEEKLKS